MLYINMVYTYYILCVTCVLIEQLVPARPPKKLKWRHTDRLPLMVLRGCFAAKNATRQTRITKNTPTIRQTDIRRICIEKQSKSAI